MLSCAPLFVQSKWRRGLEFDVDPQGVGDNRHPTEEDAALDGVNVDLEGVEFRDVDGVFGDADAKDKAFWRCYKVISRGVI